MIERVSHRSESETRRSFQTITELLAYACSQEPERPAILVECGPIITRRDLLDRCARFAAFLASRVRPGDRVIVLVGNRIEFIIAFIAIVANRATIVPVPPTVPQQHVCHLVQETAPVLAIADKQQAALVEIVRANCPSLREILVIDRPEPDGLSEFGDSATPRLLHDAACGRDDLVALHYMSASTGTPMGRMLDHGWWLRLLDVDQQLFRRSSQDRQLCCLPLYCPQSVIQLLMSLSTRGSLIAMRNITASRFWKVVRDFDATEVVSSASIPALLLQGERDPKERDHRLRIAFHSGIPKGLHSELVERFGFTWLDYYGKTECGLISRVPLHMAPELTGSGSIGLEVPGVELRIVDEAGNSVADGIVGTALVRAPNMFRGYLGHPDVTGGTVRGGWYYTGDLLRRDERGLLYLAGRNHDIDRPSVEGLARSQGY